MDHITNTQCYPNHNQIMSTQLNSTRLMSKSNQIKSNQIRSNQNMSTQIISYHIKSNHVNLNQIKSNLTISTQLISKWNEMKWNHIISEHPSNRIVEMEWKVVSHTFYMHTISIYLSVPESVVSPGIALLISSLILPTRYRRPDQVAAVELQNAFPPSRR